MPQNAAPICQSLILCDSLHQDPGTGKYFLLGTIGAIHADSYPTTHPKLGIFCELTNGHGRTAVSVKLARVVADQVEGELLGEAKGTIEFPDPRMGAALALVLGNVTFPEPGEYRIFVEANGQLLNERRLVCLKRE